MTTFKNAWIEDRIRCGKCGKWVPEVYAYAGASDDEIEAVTAEAAEYHAEGCEDAHDVALVSAAPVDDEGAGGRS